MTRMLVIAWNTDEQDPEKNRTELRKITEIIEGAGYEALDSIGVGLNDRNAEYQIAQKLITVRKNNKKYYTIITGNDPTVLLNMVRLHADNFLKVTNGNFVELKNFVRHPNIVWGYI